MSVELPEIDPNLVEVLEDVAALGPSRLFECRQLGRTPQGVGTSGSVSLNKAERHLVSCHREEAAFLLRCMAVRALQGSSSARRTVVFYTLLDPKQIKVRVKSFMAESRDWLKDTPGYETIARCVHPRGLPSPLELASSSIQLAESPQSWIYLIHGYLARNEGHSARRVALQAAQRPSSPEMRRYAFIGLGMSEQLIGRGDRAFDAFERSLDLSIRYDLDQTCVLLSALNAFFSALRLGSLKRAERVLQESLDGRGLHGPSLDLIRKAYDAQESSGEYRGLVRAFQEDCGSELGPNAQEVLNAFAT